MTVFARHLRFAFTPSPDLRVNLGLAAFVAVVIGLNLWSFR